MKRMVAVGGTLLCVSGLLRAHPHVFVTAQAGFLFDADTRLYALRISWRYDAFTTLFLFDVLDLDGDRDGQLTDADLAVVAAAETDWAPGYNGDVHLSVADKNRELGQPENARARMVEGEIVVSFELLLKAPAAMSNQRASLRLYDPSFYYSYTVTVDMDSRKLSQPCMATAIPFEPDSAAAETLELLATLTREETPSDPNVGALFADEVVLECS